MLIFAYPVLEWLLNTPSSIAERHSQSVWKPLLQCLSPELLESSRWTKAAIRNENTPEQGLLEPPAPKYVIPHIVGCLPLDASIARSVLSVVFLTDRGPGERRTAKIPGRGWACGDSLVLFGMLTRARTHSLSNYRSTEPSDMRLKSMQRRKHCDRKKVRRRKGPDAERVWKAGVLWKACLSFVNIRVCRREGRYWWKRVDLCCDLWKDGRKASIFSHTLLPLWLIS